MLLSKPEILDFAGKKLRENDVKERTEQLRSLVKENKNLIKLRNDDLFLGRFLHCCAFNVESSYKKLLDFHKFLTEYKDWMPVDPPRNVTKILEMKIIFALPQVDRVGRRICLTRLRNVNPSKLSMPDYIRIQDLWMESILDDPLVQAHGISLIADVSEFPFKLVSWLTPFNIKKLVKKLENVTAKELVIHIVRSSTMVNIALKIVMPLLPLKIKEQLKFHFDDLTALHRYVAPENLPKEYGGVIDLNFDDLNRELLEKNDDLADKLKHYRVICVGDIK